MNGVWVKDANNENFAFRRSDNCIYSENTKAAYTNFCIAPGSENRIYFEGKNYYILKIQSKNGGCITGLGLEDFSQADIYTSSGNIQYIQTLSTKWQACSK